MAEQKKKFSIASYLKKETDLSPLKKGEELYAASLDCIKNYEIQHNAEFKQLVSSLGLKKTATIYDKLLSLAYESSAITTVILYQFVGQTKFSELETKVMVYWGRYAIKKEFTHAAMLYQAFLARHNGDREEISRIDKIGEACGIESVVQIIKLKRDVMEEDPGSLLYRFERLNLDDAQEVKELLKIAKKYYYYDEYIALILLSIDKGYDFDKQEVIQMFKDGRLPHLCDIYLDESLKTPVLTTPEMEQEYLVICPRMSYLNNKNLKEYYARALYEFGSRYLKNDFYPSLQPLEAVIKGRDYIKKEDKNKDLLIYYHAMLKLAKKKNFANATAYVEDAISQVKMSNVISGYHINAPEEEDDVDYKELKKVFYFNFEEVNKIQSLDIFLEDGRNDCLVGKFSLFNGGSGEYLEYNRKISFKNDNAPIKSVKFSDVNVTGKSNMIRSGVVAFVSGESTEMDLEFSVDIDGKERDVYCTCVIDVEYEECSFSNFNILVNNIKQVDEYCVLDVTFKLGGDVEYSNDGYDEDYDDEEFVDWDEITEYNGECSVFVKFEHGKGYYYNYDGFVQIGATVEVEGKLAGQRGTITQIKEWDDSPYIKKVTKVILPEKSIDIDLSFGSKGISFSTTDEKNKNVSYINSEDKKTNNDINLISAKSFEDIGIQKRNIQDLENAITYYERVEKYSPKKRKIEKCRTEIEKIKEEKYQEADSLKGEDIKTLTKKIEIFSEIKDYKDSTTKLELCRGRIQKIKDEQAKAEKEKKQREELERLAKEKQLKKKKKIKITSIIACVLAIIIAGILMAVYIPIPKRKTIDGVTYSLKVDKYVVDDVAEYQYQVNVVSEIRGISVTEIDASAFSLCDLMIGVSLPSSITKIGESAFSFCESLSIITIPNGVNCIEKETFMYCSELRKITLPSSLLIIEERAFYSCKSMVSIRIPEGTGIIGKSAFENCRALKTVYLPNSIHTIREDAFSMGNNVTINYNGTIAEWGDVYKHASWKWSGSNYTINCLDGVITV